MGSPAAFWAGSQGTSAALARTSARRVPRAVDDAASAHDDAFPHTRRPLPWILAGFVGMLFFVPIASTQLKVHLPVDSKIDRFAIIVLVVSWFWVGGDQRAFLRTRRSKLFVGAAFLFLVLALASFVLDAGRIIHLGELELSVKRFALLGSFLIFSWFALTALRFEDVRGFATYLIGLASLMSIGMLIERRTGYNIFYEATRVALGPIAKVEAAPTNIHPTFATEGRLIVVGPTQHGLAATTMLVMVMPLALLRVFDASSLRDAASRRSWWLNGLAFALMLAGALATDRKTALVVPVVVILYIACYRPRQVLRLAPVGLVLLVGFVHLVSPHALGTVLNLSSAKSSNSTAHRVSDFTDVAPDVVAHPLLGRGFGTVDSDKATEFRINDDQYIDETWEVGAFGLLAFMWMILAPVVLARGAIRARAPGRAGIASLALATSAGCVAFFVACALFDALAFPEAPYMFFLIAALTTIAAAGPEGNVVSAHELVGRLAVRRRPAPAT